MLVLRGEASGAEGYPRRIQLERWGSRTFGHWYSSVVRDPNRGLDGTETTVETNRIIIQQKLTQSDVAAIAGIARENVSRILNEWMRASVVSRLSGYYFIDNKAALLREAEL